METGLRSLGGFLQIVGVGTVAYELHAAIARYRGRTNVKDLVAALPKRVRRWWRVYVLHSGEAHVYEEDDTITAYGDVTLSVSVERLGYEAFDSDAERVKFLFQLQSGNERRMDGQEKRLRQVEQALEAGHDKLTIQIEETDARMTRIAETIEAGSVRLRTSGFICVLSGIIFATWAPELADTLLGLPLMLSATLSGLVFALSREPGGRQ